MFKKNTAVSGFVIGVFNKVADGSEVMTGSPTAKRVLDGVGGTCANAPTFDATALVWKIDLTAADLNADLVGLRFSLTDCLSISYTIKTVTGVPDTAGKMAATVAEGDFSGAITLNGKVAATLDAADVTGKLPAALSATDVTGKIPATLSASDISGTVAASVSGKVAATLNATDVTGKIPAILASSDITGKVAATLASSDVTGKIPATLNASDISGKVTASLAAADVTGKLPAALDVADITGNVKIDLTDALDAADTVETGFSLRKAVRVILSILAGKVSGAGTGTERFRAADDASERAVVTVDSAGNRTGIQYP